MIYEFEQQDVRVTKTAENQYMLELLSKSGDKLHAMQYLASWKKGLPESWDQEQWAGLREAIVADLEKRGSITL